ncbi:MAG: WD40/YVTN/BNR-like repeat-containing protein [Acidimicrobiales bacterium]|jgi:hypothetical protein
MDESPSDVDQLFKEAAHGAGGLAHVLDPTQAIERGTKLRRYARRRRNALSGLVVLAAVLVFLVPLPQLHLFGPGGTAGTTGNHPSTSPLGSTAPTTAVTGVGPRGGVIPADFQPTSFTSVSLDEWWMLGTAHCLTGSGTCGAIVRTTDAGSRFAGIPSPPVSANDVTQLRFANSLDGYAFDPELWETTNGGTSWARIDTPGPVAELEVADGEAYALTCPAGLARCQAMDLVRAPVASLHWRKASTPVPLGYGAQFALSGANLYLLSGNEPPLVLLYSADKAVRFSRRIDPCYPGLGGRVTAAANGSPALWAACPTGTMAEVKLSVNGARTWRVGTPGGAFPNSVGIAAASASDALVWPGTETNGAIATLDRTTNGGDSYSAVISTSSFSTVVWAGFSDPSRAYALIQQGNSPETTTHLYESSDGGVAWHRVAVKT